MAAKVTGIPGLQTIEDRLGYGLHQGANQSFLDIHIDYNLHPLRKLYRKLNLIIFLNESWESNWGGHLELWDADVANCVQSIAPVFNRCALFECSEISTMDTTGSRFRKVSPASQPINIILFQRWRGFVS